MATIKHINSQRFQFALAHTFVHEGGLSNHGADPGGITNYGISLRFLQQIGYDVNADGVVDHLDIEQVTPQKAKQIYFDHFWKAHHEQLSYRTAIKLFDIGVNMGLSRANKLLQHTINHFGGKIAVDGKIGQITLKRAAAIKDKDLVYQLALHQAEFYGGLCVRKPRMIAFLRGWLKRAKWIPKKAPQPIDR